MSNKTKKETEIDFIETPIEKPKTTKKQKEQEKPDVNKEQLLKSVSAHKAEIAKAKYEIKRNKLLIKQAKIIYKLDKMKGIKK